MSITQFINKCKTCKNCLPFENGICYCLEYPDIIDYYYFNVDEECDGFECFFTHLTQNKIPDKKLGDGELIMSLFYIDMDAPKAIKHTHSDNISCNTFEILKKHEVEKISLFLFKELDNMLKIAKEKNAAEFKIVVKSHRIDDDIRDMQIARINYH